MTPELTRGGVLRAVALVLVVALVVPFVVFAVPQVVGGDASFVVISGSMEPAISVGDAVVWANTSARAHSVTAYEARIPEEAEFFATGGYEDEIAARDAWANGDGAIKTGQQYTHTFEIPGEYHYFCIPHEQAGMIGTVRFPRRRSRLPLDVVDIRTVP